MVVLPNIARSVCKARDIRDGLSPSLLHDRPSGVKRIPFGVRDEKGPGLVYAVTPCRDIVALQAVVRLVFGSVMGEFRFAAHRLFGVFICMVEVGSICQNTYQSSNDNNGGGFCKLRKPLLPDGFHQEGDDQEQHHEAEVVAHLDVVRRDLEGGEDHDQQCPRQVFFPVDMYHSGNSGGDVCQRYEFPDMPSSDEDEKVGGEGPHNRSQGTDQRRCPERPHQDVEPQ